MLRNSFRDLVEDALLDIEPRPGAAALPVIKKDRTCRSGDRLFEFRIFEDDIWRFATQLKRDFFQIACRCLQNELADLGRTRKSDLVDVRVSGQRRTRCLAETGNDI